MRVGWVLCLVMVHLPMDTRVSGEPGTQRRGENELYFYQTRYQQALSLPVSIKNSVIRLCGQILGSLNEQACKLRSYACSKFFPPTH